MRGFNQLQYGSLGRRTF